MKKLMNNTALLTFVGMILGSILGLVFGKTMNDYKFIGDIWLNTIKMIIVPLVFCIMVTAIAGQKDTKSLGRVTGRLITYYLSTTFFAAIIGMSIALLLKPGLNSSIVGLATTEVTSSADFTLKTFFVSLFSGNLFGSFSDGNVLQTMVIAIMLGISLLRVKNKEHKETLLNWFQAANEMLFSYIRMVIKLAPIGVIFLMADSFGSYGFSIFTSMAGLIGTFWVGILVQVLLVYCGVLWIFARINPFQFLKKSMPVWTFTMAACSSAANIPIGVKTAKEEFGVPESIAEFGIPLGAQINYDGSAILYSSVLIFICQLYGIPLDPGTLFKMLVVATLLSSSGGGIPGSGIVKMLIIVETFGLPVEIVGVIAGFYRFFDMGTTTGNCLGDLAGTIFVSKLEERRVEKMNKVNA